MADDFTLCGCIQIEARYKFSRFTFSKTWSEEVFSWASSFSLSFSSWIFSTPFFPRMQGTPTNMSLTLYWPVHQAAQGRTRFSSRRIELTISATDDDGA